MQKTIIVFTSIEEFISNCQERTDWSAEYAVQSNELFFMDTPFADQSETVQEQLIDEKDSSFIAQAGQLFEGFESESEAWAWVCEMYDGTKVVLNV